MKKLRSFLSWALKFISLLSFSAGLLSLWFFYEFYWRWRDCFNEAGRCFVPEEAVVYDASSVFWIGLAAAF
ncbi:MAG TPA: hypothetical protein DF383_12300, partial [Deltaproteobacteria bacterium]|nr:hypothetical protein [Deltaproteobacteria bacterium]